MRPAAVTPVTLELVAPVSSAWMAILPLFASAAVSVLFFREMAVEPLELLWA